MVERRLRSIQQAEALEWVDLTMRFLGMRMADCGTVDPPAVVCVRAGSLGVELVMEPASSVPPTGFVATEEGHLWTLDPEIGIDQLRDEAAGGVALVPALVTIGVTEEGSVLLNLECAGTLVVEGDPERAGAFLAAAALELASTPWCRELPLTLIGGDARLSVGNPRVESADDPSLVIARAARAAGATEAALGDSRTTLSARVAEQSSEDWVPSAIVADLGSMEEGAARELVRATVPHRSGVVAIVPGPVAGARWRLMIDADRTAVLHPLGLELTSVIDRELVDGASALLEARADLGDIAPVVELTPTTTGTVDPAGHCLYARFLRRRPAIDWPNEPPAGSKAVELVHFLAANEDAVSRGRLREALWPMNVPLTNVPSIRSGQR
ncbi:MAG: hypothetical protein ACRD2W_15670 [Acidimicrobiales bacterium]